MSGESAIFLIAAEGATPFGGGPIVIVSIVPIEPGPTVDMGQKPPPNFIELIKYDKRFCKRAGESCSPGWSGRMTFFDTNRPGVCGMFIGSQGTCNGAVGVEAAANDCVNTNPC
jgi:hypothetical protein